MIKTLIYFSLAAQLLSCKVKKSDVHILDFGKFTIETPSTWKKFIGTGEDSFIGRIEMGSLQFASFECGFNCDNLEEFLKEKTDTAHSFIIYPPLSAPDGLGKSKAEFKVINGRKAKIVIPLKPGDGVTGAYFDSIVDTKAVILQLEISGENLSQKNQKSFLRAIKTIKFNP